MITLSNETDRIFSTSLPQRIATELTDREIELILCDDEAIRELNLEHRGIDRPTDVLSFPLEESLPGMPLGSIVISVDRVEEMARALGHSPDEEFLLLFIHGLLHLLGYDHETDEGEMRAKEAELIRRYGLPESLIIRTEA
ncbi:rRNA maturation RNase YbeY [Nitratifractor sp.]